MKELTQAQYTDRWWWARRGRPTASEFGKIITPKTEKPSEQATGYAFELIADLYDAEYGKTDEFASAAMLNGSMMEPEAVRWYEFERELEIRKTGLCVTDDGRFGGSPDAMAGEDGGLEVKCPKASTHLFYLHKRELPPIYKPQVHGLLIVTGRSWWDFMSYCPPHPPLLLRIVPDGFTSKLRDEIESFWNTLETLKRELNLDPPPCWEEPPEPTEKHEGEYDNFSADMLGGVEDGEEVPEIDARMVL